MRTKLFFIAVAMFLSGQLNAQVFISKATIEYEVKTNIKKTMGTGVWDEMMKDAMPTFKTGYFTYTFADNKSVFKFDHWDPNMKIPDWYKKSDESFSWYFDFTNAKFNMNKNIAGTDFNINDSMPVIEWHLSNESRIISGYNCRKAVGKIMDSVYVFAFYTDEITIPGGPCSVNGLPGMILGLTIPRMYTSWIATKIDIEKVDEKLIVPVTSKKIYTKASFKAMLDEHTKDWFGEDDPDSKKWIEQFYWKQFL